LIGTDGQVLASVRGWIMLGPERGELVSACISLSDLLNHKLGKAFSVS